MPAIDTNDVVLSGDAYKYSHFRMYDPSVRAAYLYIAARQPAKDRSRREMPEYLQGPWQAFRSITPKDIFQNVVYMGLQGYVNSYLRHERISVEALKEAELVTKNQGIPFNKEGFFELAKLQSEYLEKDLDYWPVALSGLLEGSVVPVGTPLVTVASSDKKFLWLPFFLETSLIRAIWYPTEVATIAWQIRQVCKYFLEYTAEDEMIEPSLRFMLHDFGARAASSSETAAIGGAAHLALFDGTDNEEGITYAISMFNAELSNVAKSCPAAEHSVIMSWGKDNEEKAIRHIIETNQDYPLISVVSDTYDLRNALQNLWGDKLVDLVKSSKARIVVRPDSGDPTEMVMLTLESLKATYGGTTNKKGYFVLPDYIRVIQGDGVNLYSIFRILNAMEEARFSAENIVFGMGSALLQAPSRDTHSIAMKLSAVCRDGQLGWEGVKKTVATDTKKTSRAGRFFVHKANGVWKTEDFDNLPDNLLTVPNQLKLVWDGKDVCYSQIFGAIRERARS